MTSSTSDVPSHERQMHASGEGRTLRTLQPWYTRGRTLHRMPCRAPLKNLNRYTIQWRFCVQLERIPSGVFETRSKKGRADKDTGEVRCEGVHVKGLPPTMLDPPTPRGVYTLTCPLPGYSLRAHRPSHVPKWAECHKRVTGDCLLNSHLTPSSRRDGHFTVTGN